MHKRSSSRNVICSFMFYNSLFIRYLKRCFLKDSIFLLNLSFCVKYPGSMTRFTHNTCECWDCLPVQTISPHLFPFLLLKYIPPCWFPICLLSLIDQRPGRRCHKVEQGAAASKWVLWILEQDHFESKARIGQESFRVTSCWSRGDLKSFRHIVPFCAV